MGDVAGHLFDETMAEEGTRIPLALVKSDLELSWWFELLPLQVQLQSKPCSPGQTGSCPFP